VLPLAVLATHSLISGPTDVTKRFTKVHKKRGHHLVNFASSISPRDKAELRARSFSSVRRALNLALDVVPLAEKGVPVVEDFLVLVGEVVPIGSGFLLLQGGLRESSRGVLAGEDWERTLSSAFLAMEIAVQITCVGPAGSIGFFATDIEYRALCVAMLSSSTVRLVCYLMTTLIAT
jgi:hypothetical protein